MYYLGVTLEKELFRVAVIRKEKKRLLVESTHSFPYGSDNVQLFYNLPPFHTGKPIDICSGLGSQDLFIRRLHLPLSERRKILKALPFQLESLIPFPNETPLVCTQLRPLGKQMASVTIMATTENKLTAHLEQLRTLDIEPSQISCTPTALMRFVSWLKPEEERVICLDVRGGVASCVLIEKGEVSLSQALSAENDPMTFEKWTLFLKQKGIPFHEIPWLLTGDCEPSLCSERQLTLSDSTLKEYAVAIGLALDAALGDEASTQFCQGNLLPISTLQTRKKQLLTYAACCLGSALLMGICSFVLVSKKQTLLTEELKSHQPSLKVNASIQGIREGLISWEGSLKGKKNSFALIPNVPRVSDLLAYLSTHPSLLSEKGTLKEGVEIESIHYSLVKYPKIGDPSSPYVARVELDLSSQTPRAARDFHEALLKGDSVVNAKKEIKWQAQNKTYHTSFELAKGGLP